MLFNGKYTGAGKLVDPFAIMNDGLIDITWIHNEDTMGVAGIAGMLGKSEKGGLNAYDGHSYYYRGCLLYTSDAADE